MQADRHFERAQGTDGFRQRDGSTVDFLPHCLGQRICDRNVGDGAVQVATLAGATLQRDAQTFQLFGDALQIGRLLEALFLCNLLDLFNPLELFRGCRRSQALRNQIVAGESAGYRTNLTCHVFRRNIGQEHYLKAHRNTSNANFHINVEQDTQGYHSHGLIGNLSVRVCLRTNHSIV